MTEPVPGLPATVLAAATEILAQSWNRRSAAERDAVADQIAGAKPGPDPRRSEVLERLRGIAALSGGLAPRDLVRGLAGDLAEVALDLLAPDFDRTWNAGRWTWTLRTGPRQQTLAELAAGGGVPRALGQASAVPTDAAGEALRDLVTARTEPPGTDIPPRGEASSPVGLQALTWAEPLGGLAGDLAEARRVAALTEVRDGYSTLLEHGVFGRTAELTALRSFAEAPVDPARPVPLLPMIGIGGSGKSTVLAAFVQPYIERLVARDTTAPAVVVIDFDRLAFRAHAQLELSFELTRQLGCAFPEARADFSVLRYQTRQQDRATRVDVVTGDRQVESDSQGSSGFAAAAAVLVRMHGLTHRPVVLVLDTVEEWQRERLRPGSARTGWNDPEYHLLEWTESLRNVMGLEGLRVVLSGRAEVALAGNRAAARPPLGALSPAAAVEVVLANGIPDHRANPLVEVLGGNPLTLLVGVRFFLRLPSREQEAFLRDGGTAAGLDEELRRAILYDRFLEHIEDERVRTLAHPGLVLRRVTSDLVRHVLAPQCGLGEVDDATAAELADKLADEMWLVRRTADGLRHQPDVRRAMLGMMSRDSDHAATVQRIHRAAVDWYAGGHELSMDPADAEVEWFYHSLMVEGEQDVDWTAELTRPEPEPRWVRLALALAAGVTDLPTPVRAQVLVLTGDELTPDEVDSLPSATWDRWMERRGSR
jgi:hypothetical protein